MTCPSVHRPVVYAPAQSTSICGLRCVVIQISGNSAGNLRARVSARFRKFPWKFTTAGGRVVHHSGEIPKLRASRSTDVPHHFSDHFRSFVSRCSWTYSSSIHPRPLARMSDTRAALSAARDAGDITLMEYLAELRKLREAGAVSSASEGMPAGSRQRGWAARRASRAEAWQACVALSGRAASRWSGRGSAREALRERAVVRICVSRSVRARRCGLQWTVYTRLSRNGAQRLAARCFFGLAQHDGGHDPRRGRCTSEWYPTTCARPNNGHKHRGRAGIFLVRWPRESRWPRGSR